MVKNKYGEEADKGSRLYRTFHITIGSAPAHGLSLEGDLRLVKSALLYADQVKLCSLLSSLMVTMSVLMESDQKRYFEMFETLLPAMAEDRIQGQQIAEMMRHPKGFTTHIGYGFGFNFA